MDVSEYRTRYPPKEHEEAVRMLLEGLDKQTPEAKDLKRQLKGSKSDAYYANKQNNLTTRHRDVKMLESSTNRSSHEDFTSSSSVDSGSLARGQPGDEYEDEDEFECDEQGQFRRNEHELEFNSEESSSQDHIQVSPMISRSRQVLMATRLPTATKHRPPSPLRMQSKATSTTSESVSSAAHDSGQNQDDEFNGNYEAIPSRTIAIQCDLKLSSVKRDGLLLDSASSDLASMQASSISSTRYGFYKLSPEIYEQRRRLARSISSHYTDQLHHIEATTGEMESLSNQHSSLFVSAIDRNQEHYSGREDENAECELATARDKPDQSLIKQHQHRRESSCSRVRDSLPKRPKTALSYVSTSCLKPAQDAPSSERSLSDYEDSGEPISDGIEGLNERLRDRTMSQQVISNKSQLKSPFMGPTRGETNSDSDLGAAESFCVPHNEELLLTRRGQQMPAININRTQRPHLKSKGQMIRRSNTLTDGISEQHFEQLPTDNETDELNWSSKRAHGLRPTAHLSNEKQQAKLSRFNSISSHRGPRVERNSNLIAGQIRRATNTKAEVSEQYRAQAVNDPVNSRRSSQESQRNHLARGSSATNNVRGVNLSRAGRSSSQQALSNCGEQMLHTSYVPSVNRTLLRNPRHGKQPLAQIGRSTSMKQINPSSTQAAVARFLSPAELQTSRRYYTTTDCESSCCEQGDQNAANENISTCNECKTMPHGEQQERRRSTLQRSTTIKRSGSEDSESPLTKTWANPSSTSRVDTISRTAQNRRAVRDLSSADEKVAITKGATRSHSMRDVVSPNKLEAASIGTRQTQQRFRRIYCANQAEDFMQYRPEETSEELNSSLEDSDQKMPFELLTRATAHHHPLDNDSQQRLNECGLPVETDSVHPSTERKLPVTSGMSASSSHLGLSSSPAASATRYATTGRRVSSSAKHDLHPQHYKASPAITGRAMSQQSLTRPTMPLSRRLRRGITGGSQSGVSDLDGSSMSLATRMRYESAHTRTPVVMYIPQAPLKSSSSENIRKPALSGSLLRKSSRQSFVNKTGRHASLSQERNHRGSSRQGSDNELTSSMLRTLVKPRSIRLQSTTTGSGLNLKGNGASGRRRYVNEPTRAMETSDSEEFVDGIGQLATEIDSYKFRRRYSVPKDAKINWFSKLKQRVTSSRS